MTLLSLLDPPPEDQPGGSELLPAPAGWPAPPAPAVYHELLGEIVGTITPHTEADPVALLTQLLVSFGAAVGRAAWFQVEATRHHGNEFMCLVGDSARGRKGSSWDHVRRLIIDADPSLEPRILTGLSSGEGVIWAVRDPTSQDPRHQRPAAAGDRARVRLRAEGWPQAGRSRPCRRHCAPAGTADPWRS
jgi:hypothetical protein